MDSSISCEPAQELCLSSTQQLALDTPLDLATDFRNHSPPWSSDSRIPGSPASSDRAEEHKCPDGDCGRTFKRKNALHRHIVSIHRRTGETCPFCPAGKKVFNRSDNFQRSGLSQAEPLQILMITKCTRHVTSRHKLVATHDPKLLGCLKRLYQGGGCRRMSWKK
jgi:hypothetical protein